MCLKILIVPIETSRNFSELQHVCKFHATDSFCQPQFVAKNTRFLAGKAADNTDDAACIAGTVAGALHVRQVAKLYGVPATCHGVFQGKLLKKNYPDHLPQIVDFAGRVCWYLQKQIRIIHG